MWKKRTALLAVVVMAATTGASTPTGALAGGRGESMYGDLDGDRVTDRVTLLTVAPDRCGVLVQLGRRGGGYQNPRLYAYPAPGDGGVLQCPDMGTIVDLGRDGTVEIVAAWFHGRPSGVDEDLLVLRNFRPAGGFAGMFQPSYLDTADFNGDGRRDVYQWTDQGEGFASYLNTADGRLEPGPVRYCAGFVRPELTDFTRDRRADVLLSFHEGCEDEVFSGVVALLGEGRTEYLERDVDGENFWSVAVTDADLDGVPDARTVNEVTGEVSHFLVRDRARFLRAPTPAPDVAIVAAPVPTPIPVLANDAVTVAARLEIAVPPRFGRVEIAPDKTVVYVPPVPPPASVDTFFYRVIDDGKVAETEVIVELRL